jgi:hypothetical protein
MLRHYTLLAFNQWRSQMAKDRERTPPGGEHRHSVLEGPEYIAGVPGTKNEGAKVASRNPEECESVLDGPECIQGVKPQKRRSSGRR